jgi:hypothetical protein
MKENKVFKCLYIKQKTLCSLFTSNGAGIYVEMSLINNNTVQCLYCTVCRYIVHVLWGLRIYKKYAYTVISS